jgi:TonB family protein
MPEAALLQPTESKPQARDLRLLIAMEPRSRAFLRNLRDLLFHRESASASSTATPGTFWADVFVERSLPWRGFQRSAAYHILAIALIWAGSRFISLQPRVTPQSQFAHAEVVYYSPSEYLPPLDTRRPTANRAAKADPEYSAQPIISLPPEANNRSQTIVVPPNIRLQRDVALPNLVSTLERLPGHAPMPVGPVPVVRAAEISRLAPRMDRSIMDRSIIAPPDVSASLRNTMKSAPQEMAQTPVIAPPPALDSTSTRRLGDLSVAPSAVIAPAPQLELSTQRAVGGRGPATLGKASAVIAPPPSLAAPGRSRSAGDLLALSLHPAVGAPPNPPAGNRRGSFAATPEGHRGASGTPGADVAKGNAEGSGPTRAANSNLPAGLYVGKASNAASTVAGDPAAKNSNAYTVNPNLIANARRPRIPARTLQPEAESKLSPEERTVFGDRKFYSLSLNMPNLNSAGGSWIVRFAALHPDTTGGKESSELSAPSATRKVDPAYPLELMRQNVSGTVILYGVIRADGTVARLKVLRSADERLDQFASAAIAKWQFQPATKNGAPVDVEATFWIPFKPGKTKSDF